MSNDGDLSVVGLTFSYPGSAPALRGVTFEIAAGEVVGLIGPNGAGKTTLFLCLAGVLPVRDGRLSVCGLNPALPDERRKLPLHVGVVFQNSDDQLFNATVFDDVAFGPLNLGLSPDEVRSRVTESLATVGLSGFEPRVPFHLAGGEKRRVALAGVLAMRPSVLFLDEPTVFLDPRGRRELLSLLTKIPGTKMIATHDLEFVLATCTRVLLLESGKVVADGQTRAILADAELMDAHGLEVPPSLK
jgi:cobalt/nickel transport system ATP-binding protein